MIIKKLVVEFFNTIHSISIYAYKYHNNTLLAICSTFIGSVSTIYMVDKNDMVTPLTQTKDNKVLWKISRQEDSSIAVVYSRRDYMIVDMKSTASLEVGGSIMEDIDCITVSCARQQACVVDMKGNICIYRILDKKLVKLSNIWTPTTDLEVALIPTTKLEVVHISFINDSKWLAVLCKEKDKEHSALIFDLVRSEERRVGKEC